MRTALSVALLVAALTLGTAGGALAQANRATVGLDADSQDLEAGETTTVRVVVSNASDGVGSVGFAVSVSNANVLEITSVEVTGNARAWAVADDGTVATASTSGLDASEESVTVAEVTVRAVSAGRADLNLTVERLASPDGRAYEATTTNATFGVASEGGGNTLFGLAIGLGIIAVALGGIAVHHVRNR